MAAPVAQWVKRWPTDLAVPSSRPAQGEIFSTVNGVPLHIAFHYHPPIVLINRKSGALEETFFFCFFFLFFFVFFCFFRFCFVV